MQQGWLFGMSRPVALFLVGICGTTAFAAKDPSPALPRGSISLEKTAITLSYNPEMKVADWVFYPLGPDQLQDCFDRPSNFRPDPELDPSASAQLADYKNSGYDRGHLSPAGDNKWSADAMNESFLLSNIAPQPPKFNRGIWSRLEGLVRAMALKAGGLWITTGPVLTSKVDTIGDSAVAVPASFYKVLATQTTKGMQAIAFILPNDASESFDNYAVSVAEAENVTRLDFLSGVSDAVKSHFDLGQWDLRAKFKYLPCDAKRQPASWFQAPALN